jgi:hypothetical protein
MAPPGFPRRVSCLGLDPSLSQIQISSAPERYEPKRICCPSGEYWAKFSYRVDEMNLVARRASSVEAGPPTRQMSILSSSLT